MKNILTKIFNNEILSHEEIEKVFRWALIKAIAPAAIGAFIFGLAKKGVTTEELTSLTKILRSYAQRIDVGCSIVDSCGTGADNSQTFNISTASAIVAASFGAKVVKQTNSSITSRTGSSEFIHYLKLPLCTTEEQVKEQVNKHNIAFVHSPQFNKAVQILNPIRQELGIRSTFNFTGPMINPSFPDAQLVGVCEHSMIEKMANTLNNLGTKRAMIVHGLQPALDEISICSKTHVYEINNGIIREYYLSPEDFGMNVAELKTLLGATALYNANLVIDIFRGKIKDAKVDVIALNAGAMLYLNGIAKTLHDGVILAYSAISSGKAYEKLMSISQASHV